MKQRVYIDTSVIGGCFDEEFAADSQALFRKFQDREMIAVVSETMLQELVKAPKEVLELVQRLPDEAVEIVHSTSEAVSLAEIYIVEKAVSQNESIDALHIAIATVERVHVLVSWNFKHIVNLQRIRAYNAVNLREGYPVLEIRSPKEILDAED